MKESHDENIPTHFLTDHLQPQYFSSKLLNFPPLTNLPLLLLFFVLYQVVLVQIILFENDFHQLFFPEVIADAPFSIFLDINECADDTHDCDNSGFSRCANQNGSYECSCVAGNFSGSGRANDPCLGKVLYLTQTNIHQRV